jgi:hypothetical protein
MFSFVKKYSRLAAALSVTRFTNAKYDFDHTLLCRLNNTN